MFIPERATTARLDLRRYDDPGCVKRLTGRNRGVPAPERSAFVDSDGAHELIEHVFGELATGVVLLLVYQKILNDLSAKKKIAQEIKVRYPSDYW